MARINLASLLLLTGCGVAAPVSSPNEAPSDGIHYPSDVVTSIDPELLDNGEAFPEAFYQQFDLRHTERPLALPGGIEKDYLFPTLYGDVTTAVGVFFCDYDAALAALPAEGGLKPVNMGLGRSAVIISSYRYNRVRGLKPYNEIAVSIPVVPAGSLNVPVLPLLMSGFRGLGYYVVSMPVTTLENQIRGTQIWGLPKVVQQIELDSDGGDYVTKAHSDDGSVYLEMRVPMTGQVETVERESLLYSQKGEQRLKSVSKGSGAFATTTYPTAFLHKHQAPLGTFIEVGDDPLLTSLMIEPQPFRVQFARTSLSAFDLPQPW